MEFKKCERCGNFFISNNNTCSKCLTKDEAEKTKLKNYFENNIQGASLEEISNNTGITVKNLDRFINADEFSNISANIQKNSTDGFNNLSINL